MVFLGLPAVFREAFSGKEAIGVPRGKRKRGGVGFGSCPSCKNQNVRPRLLHWWVIGGWGELLVNAQRRWGFPA